MTRRFGSFNVVAVAVSVFLLSGTAEAEVIETWTSGETTVTLEASGTLTVSGAGAMANHSVANVPWANSRNAITNAVIEDGVTSIGDNAFSVCVNLKSVTISNSVASIGVAAFFGTGLTSIVIPRSVTNIGNATFARCSNLMSIEVAEDNAHYISSQGGVLFNKKRDQLIAYPGGKRGKYTVPNSVKSIANSAFQGSVNLTSVTIPSSVTSIGRSAFSSCDSLTSIISLNNPTPTILSPDGINKANVCLYVFQDAIKIYRNVSGWKDFKCIRDKATFEQNTSAAAPAATPATAPASAPVSVTTPNPTPSTSAESQASRVATVTVDSVKRETQAEQSEESPTLKGRIGLPIWFGNSLESIWSGTFGLRIHISELFALQPSIYFLHLADAEVDLWLNIGMDAYFYLFNNNGIRQYISVGIIFGDPVYPWMYTDWLDALNYYVSLEELYFEDMANVHIRSAYGIQYRVAKVVDIFGQIGIGIDSVPGGFYSTNVQLGMILYNKP